MINCAIVIFLDAFAAEASTMAIESVSTATPPDGAPNPLRFKDRVAAPPRLIAPPPESPSPEFTLRLELVNEKLPSVAEIPDPAMAVARLSTLYFLDDPSVASIMAMRSSARVTDPRAPNSFRSRASEAEPPSAADPPPESPSPAVTVIELLVNE